jgi:antitoxin (DNA-binding transcriptional repressor) of toxin-antitoxin stability system
MITPIASESVIIELAFFWKMTQLLLPVFFIVENSIVIFRKINTMVKLTLNEAQNQLPEILKAAAKGQQVIIQNHDGKNFQIISLPVPSQRPQYGSAKGLVKMRDNFEDPIEDFDFTDRNGQTFAMETVDRSKLLRLISEPELVSVSTVLTAIAHPSRNSS